MNSLPVYPSAPAKGWMPWGALVPVLGIAFVMVSILTMSFILGYFGLLDAQEEPSGFAGLVAFLLLPFSALGGVVLAWAAFVERRPFVSIGLGGSHRARTFLTGHLTGIAMASAVVAATWAAGGFTAGAIAPAFASPAALSSIAVLLACFALQSSVEELLFRGWIFSGVGAKFGVAWGIVLSAAVFAILHLDRSAGVIFTVNTVLFSVFACALALSARNVLGAMGWHAGWNWMFATGFELRITGMDTHQPALLVAMAPTNADYLTGGAQGPEGSIICTIVLLMGICYFALRARRDRAKPA